MKLIHLTDLHIAPAGMGEALEGAADRAALAIDLINKDHADAELCVITGDIVYDPDETAYEMAADILSELTVPTISLLGNHDDRAMAQRLLPSIPKDRNGFAQGLVKTNRGVCVTLDTNANGTHAGAFCAHRQEWLKETLNAHPEPVWLFMHHAPFATGLAAMDTIGLDPGDAEALGDILTAHGRVEHLFFGHYHRPMSGQWRGIPFSSHRSMMLQCALDLTTRDHVPAICEEPQFAIVTAQLGLTVVHYHDFASGKPVISMGSADSDQ